MSRSFVVPAALLSVFLLGATGCGPQKEKEPPKPKVIAAADLPPLGAAPAWRLKDVNGKDVSSEQFKGKIVVIDFWATWCVPCKVEIPGYIELTKKYSKDGLVIVGISTDQAGPEVVKEFMEKNRINYPIVMMDDDVAAAFAPEAIPTTFLIDRAGQIRDRKVGAEATESYEQKILALLR